MRSLARACLPVLIALPSLAPGQAQPAPPPGVKPGWKWTMDSVNSVVNAVRAGRSLQPAKWPGGARVAVLFSFDADNETVSLRFGEPTVGALSQGQYGGRVGLRRILDVLDKNQVPATFFIPSVSLALTPEMLPMIKKSGRHEIGVHGWIHEMNSTLSDSAERALVDKAIGELTHMTGERPVGYRAPSWNFSPNTLSILRDMGMRYESSLMADDRPYELLQDGRPTGLVELPVEWILDDAPLFDPRGNSYSSPRDVAKVWMDEFDKAWAEGTMIVFTMHPHISGHRSRIVALEELIAHIKAKPGVWFATHRDAAEYVRREAKLGEPVARAQSGGLWPQHSTERPRPPVMKAPTQTLPVQPPPGAVVLFDGRDLSKWEGRKGGQAPWHLVPGLAMEVKPGSGDIQTRTGFGDVELHVEWATPNPPKGTDQDRGNSGVFLMTKYEIQVLDSYENVTYADGQAAAIYGQFPPLFNVSRPPGEWQTYDIVFHRPRFDASGKLLGPARATVRHNGVLVQDNVALLGPTTHMVRTPYSAHADRLPIALQDHGHLVRFRNIWLKDLER
jgi:peptidoglycan/xylan/chitin deacetylase (PgdA/CDA1 family)